MISASASALLKDTPPSVASALRDASTTPRSGRWSTLAARLCSEAGDGKILIDRKVQAAIETLAITEPAGELLLKGLHRPIATFNVNAASCISRRS